VGCCRLRLRRLHAAPLGAAVTKMDMVVT
jgi:hypothetical protein